jgi:hypothetical protein
MTDRSRTQRTFRSTAQTGKLLLVFAALCLLTLPQTYSGGASLPHPHAIFQFWIPGGDIPADHHHDGEHDRAITVPMSPAAAAAAARAARSATATISQITPSYESSDAIGGVLAVWSPVLFAAVMSHDFRDKLPLGRRTPPEIPPPRAAIGLV